MTSKETALEICKILDSKKGADIGIIGVKSVSDITDYFVICSGRSSTQVKALGEELEFQMEKQGVFAMHKDGLSEGRWIAVDYGDVIVHIFHEEMRSFYQLEKLWNNGSNYETYTSELN
ncbi:MAG: ribosome silencing factor [Clostridia bacterium]